jgi:mitogen-activated protein kinase organizer 1
VRTMRGHTGPVNDVQFNVNGNYCLSCGQDGTLRLWNPHRPGVEGSGSGGLLVKTFAATHNKGALGAAITRDNSKFASCGNDTTALLWDVASGQVLRKFWEHTGRVNCIAFNNSRGGTTGSSAPTEESVLITGCYDTLVRVFDLRARNQRPIQTLDGGRDSITSLVVTGHQIIASDVNGA